MLLQLKVTKKQQLRGKMAYLNTKSFRLKFALRSYLVYSVQVIIKGKKKVISEDEEYTRLDKVHSEAGFLWSNCRLVFPP